MGLFHRLAKFVAAPGTLADGQRTETRCNAQGALVVAGDGGGGGALPVQYAPPLSYDSITVAPVGTLKDSGVIVAAPGTLLDINGYNGAAATRYFQLFDLVAVPADTTVPNTIPLEVPAGTHFSLTFAAGQGRPFVVGIVWCSSTTQLTKTLSPAPDMIINAQYR